MPKFQLINVYDAKQRLAKEKIQIVDIRDPQSYQSGHIEGAFQLNQSSITRFTEEAALHTPVFVICYHGNSSKGVAQYLCDLGYLSVYSVEGGMAAWRHV